MIPVNYIVLQLRGFADLCGKRKLQLDRIHLVDTALASRQCGRNALYERAVRKGHYYETGLGSSTSSIVRA